jgi:hypothetical protein
MRAKCSNCKHVARSTDSKGTKLYCEHPALSYNEIPTTVSAEHKCEDYERESKDENR